MINLARQAFANPFLSSVGASLQPGVVSTVGRCPCCGNTVAIAGTIQPQTGGLNPLGLGANFSQQTGGVVPNPYAFPQTTGFGQINPLTSQFTNGFPQTINPFAAQLASNWPVSGLSHQGVGRTGAYGTDPRFAFAGSPQFGYSDPNVIPGTGNPAIAGDPISSLLSQQFNPLAQQQVPIRPLIAGQQGVGLQPFTAGIPSAIPQWTDPYRAFIEAQLISQLTNPLYQLQRAYGGVPDVSGFGMPFGAGQQFNPLLSNVPFYG